MDPYYESAPHTKLIIEYLERLERGDIRNLMIWMPPRMGKTYHAGERFIAWYLGRNPRNEVVTASYSLKRAKDSSGRARQLVRSKSYPFDVGVDPNKDSELDWRTTAGGSCYAVGVEGSLTGQGAHLLVIDDPTKGRKEADSEVSQEDVESWYREVARTRLMRGGKQLIMQTRWHEKDLSGILLEQNSRGWTVLRLPWLAEENDPIGRSVGQVLWDNPIGDVPTKEEIGSRGWEALYQQNPQPDEGLTFRREWMEHRYFNTPEAQSTVLAVDGAWKTGVENDRSALALWGKDETRYFPMDAIAGRWAYPDLRRCLLDFAVKCQPDKILIEDAASGSALIAELHADTSLPVVGVKPITSKIARVEAITPLFEAGRVWIPQRAEWVDDWVSEHLRFPAGAHDDYVDTTSMALTDLQERGVSVFGYY